MGNAFAARLVACVRGQVVAHDADKAWDKEARRGVGRPAARSVAGHGLSAEPVVAASRAVVGRLVSVGSAFAKLLDLIAGGRRAPLLPAYQIASGRAGGRAGGSGLARAERAVTV